MSTKDDEAGALARKHYEIEPGITQILRIRRTDDAEADPKEPIKLLEVNENTVASGILPISFAANPAADIHFPSLIVEITPDEFCDIQNERLKLPDGWVLADEIPRQEEACER